MLEKIWHPTWKILFDAEPYTISNSHLSETIKRLQHYILSYQLVSSLTDGWQRKGSGSSSISFIMFASRTGNSFFRNK